MITIHARFGLFALALVGSRLAASVVTADLSTTPNWIWVDGATEIQVARKFEISETPVTAKLTFAADFAAAEVKINGRPALSIEPYCQSATIDVLPWMRHGDNEIVITAKSVPGPAAVALSLAIANAAQAQAIHTDASWISTRGKTIRLAGQVQPELWGVSRRSIAIDPFENYEQWKQATGGSAATDPATFWSVPGFEITLIHTARPDEGSWVSMAFDPDGRLTIAREDQGLLRMTLDGDRTSVAKIEVIDQALLECRGLVYAHGSLYASANNSKRLYRLTDSNADGQFDKTDELREFSGGVGHGRNDLALGPSGLIYSIYGDSVDVPKENVLDRTSPFRDARRGKKTSEGFLLRSDRDGKEWELLCGGLRNPYGVALNQYDDTFTYDADAEFDMGTPWYRPTRIVQLVSGADYGWRGITGKWPPYFPDHAARAVPLLDVGKGSPTALAFGTKSRFPAPYREALFILDWTYGRVLAMHLAPRGAGYRAAAETFLQGRPLNVTDLAFGPDGALYLVTGGRKTQSALYRISYTGKSVHSAEISQHERACAEHATLARQWRRALEAFHGGEDPAAVDSAWKHLDSPDPLLRYAARVAVEHQPLSTWRDLALAANAPGETLSALTSLVASGEANASQSALEQLLRLDPQQLDASQSLTYLHVLDVIGRGSPKLFDGVRQQLLVRLEQLWAHRKDRCLTIGQLGTGAQLRRELLRMLVEVRAPGAVERAMELLESQSQEDRLMGLFILRNVKEGWSEQSRRVYFSTLSGGQRFVAGEGLPRFLATLRSEALATLSEQEKTQLADLLAAKVSSEDDLPVSARPLVKKWTIEELSPHLAESKERGDVARGASVFRDALCVHCHRVGARGSAVGPDLTHVAGRFSRRDILQSILTPAAVVAENYRNVQVSLKDGRSLVGRVVEEGDYRSETLRLATNPLRPSEVVEINKRDIDRTKLSETSPMPAGLLDPFDEQAVLDLLAFLDVGAKTNVAP